MLNSDKLQPRAPRDESFGWRYTHNILVPGEEHVVGSVFACRAPITKPIDLAALKLKVSDEFSKDLGRNVVDIDVIAPIDRL